MRFVSDIYLTDWMWDFVFYTTSTSSSLAPLFLSPGDTHGSHKGRVVYSSCQPEAVGVFFFLNKAADVVTIILLTSASVSSSILSSCNWSSPNTESLGVAVMLCQQRALCHLGVDMHYLANSSQCLALENTCLKGAVDLRQRIHYHKPEFKPI